MKRKAGKTLAAAFALAAALSGCGGAQTEQETKDKAVLAVSFGTSYEDSREKTIGAVETALQTAFPDYEVRRAFTSQTIIDILAERDDIQIDNVTEALEQAVADGIETLVVQPTHLMSGYEYMDLAKELTEYKDSFIQVALAKPLLSGEADFDAVAEAIVADTAAYAQEGTAICFMGHGTEADANGVYEKLQEVLREKGHENYFIGTVEAEPSFEDVLAGIKAGGYTRVVLQPLMLVAGDHANQDMAGDGEDSWKTWFTKEGYEVECVIRGLGEIPAIQELYITHTQAAVDSLEE
ncbi:sirohydrochlorin cobaltochelatase [Anaerotignum lactatifermentans]|uniref:Sirohydrochlorin cobaltochelatase n=1 Tax=Anaerotignum lactatifermentans TaxID=160404 RepID=A0ABS2GA14_9FIRM|nr:sirohydrochlorin cobaltochelatase [Anaerotignum lactatifermentans]MBM6829794.1 sirohydrochlorin cobaltochelatase [Anaerotignum lactatifermentans]MBM6878266.1 sirohydrochlorin cobaltochelatase [Anaerotignum lactatifermentans]MBM6951346.1 sirohydrochlorin cobaltochelatase [Anaerotignum lactatifermentans]